jgi:hypothetical protein
VHDKLEFEWSLLDENNLIGHVVIDKFQEELTTELFNLLIFLQEELRMEVNDILNQLQNEERIYHKATMFNQSLGGVQTPGSTVTNHQPPLSFKFKFVMHGIKVMAKTPTGNMVVFDVPIVEAAIENRDPTLSDSPPIFNYPSKKVFVSGKIELKLSLMCQTLTEEKKLAGFDAILEGHNTAESITAQDVLLVELKQPTIFIHSNAIDRAVLVYLNCRSAYQTWKDEIDLQRVSKIRPGPSPRGGSANSDSSIHTKVETPSVSSDQTHISKANPKLFLKVTVSDFKIKMPLLATSKNDSGQALALMIQSIGVSGTLGDITGFKGTFNGFELCFTSESENMDSLKLNTCQVKDGELEIISETQNVDQQAGFVQHHHATSNSSAGGKVAGIWNLLIKWNMQGLDVKLDTNAGVLFSRLGRTLTTLTEDNPINEAEGSKLRYKELEAKLNTQRKTVEDLKSLGATESIIQSESQQLQEIEKELKNEFQRKRRNESKIQKSETKGTNEQQLDPDIELIFAMSDAMAKGVLSAVKSSGSSQNITGYNGDCETLNSIWNDGILATLYQGWRDIGAQVIRTSLDVAKGKSVPKKIIMPTFVVDKPSMAAIVAGTHDDATPGLKYDAKKAIAGCK